MSYHALQLEALGAKQIDRLLILVRKPESVVVPSELQTLKVWTEFCQTEKCVLEILFSEYNEYCVPVNHMIHMDLCAYDLRSAHHLKDDTSSKLKLTRILALVSLERYAFHKLSVT